MGTIKATNIEPIANNGTVTLGSSGDTFTLGSGVVPSNLMYPAFNAVASAQQDLSDATETLVVFAGEYFDTDNCFDNTAGNYKFTPNKAGKYFLYFALDAFSRTDDKIIKASGRLYKNGTRVNTNIYNLNQGGSSGVAVHALPITQGFIVEANGSSDYFQVKVYVDVSSGTGPALYADGTSGTSQNTTFGGYRIGS